MQIDWTHFTPWASLAGGVTIGLAAAALLLLSGRTLGVSGIFYGAMTGLGPEFRWRATFLLGLLAAPSCAYDFLHANVADISTCQWRKSCLAASSSGLARA